MSWQAKDHVRLVFHATFKRFNQGEVDSVKTLMAELGDYEVEYAFLQLSEQHPYLLFDKSQHGVQDFETRRSKGCTRQNARRPCNCQIGTCSFA
jgi:hypothetical protein